MTPTTTTGGAALDAPAGTEDVALVGAACATWT
jgi:hypothetical protein